MKPHLSKCTKLSPLLLRDLMIQQSMLVTHSSINVLEPLLAFSHLKNFLIWLQPPSLDFWAPTQRTWNIWESWVSFKLWESIQSTRSITNQWSSIAWKMQMTHWKSKPLICFSKWLTRRMLSQLWRSFWLIWKMLQLNHKLEKIWLLKLMNWPISLLQIKSGISTQWTSYLKWVEISSPKT